MQNITQTQTTCTHGDASVLYHDNAKCGEAQTWQCEVSSYEGGCGQEFTQIRAHWISLTHPGADCGKDEAAQIFGVCGCETVQRCADCGKEWAKGETVTEEHHTFRIGGY